MKKTKLILLIAIFIFFILITVVNANEVNITLNASNTKIQKEQEVEVTINLNELKTKGAMVLKGKVQFDEEVLEYVGKTFKSGWNGAVSDDGTSFNAFRYEEINEKEVLNLKFRLKENTKVKETKVAVKDLMLVLEESTDEQILQNSEINFEIVNKTNNIYIIGLVFVIMIIIAFAIVIIKKKK